MGFYNGMIELLASIFEAIGTIISLLSYNDVKRITEGVEKAIKELGFFGLIRKIFKEGVANLFSFADIDLPHKNAYEFGLFIPQLVELIVDAIAIGKGASKATAKIVELIKDLPQDLKKAKKALSLWRKQLILKLDKKILESLEAKGVKVAIEPIYNNSIQLSSGVPIKTPDGNKFIISYQNYILETFENDKNANTFLKQLNNDKKLLDDLFFEKALKPYFDRRKRLHDLGEKAIDNLWKKKIKDILLNKGDFITLFTKRFDKYPALVKGYNQAEFKTTIKKNGKLIDEIEEFSLSGDSFLDENFKNRFGTFPNLNLPENTIDVFSDYDNFKRFVENAVDFKGKSRRFDSEIKYIYNFLKNHLNKGDEFIIETSNIFKTCGSCSREFLMLQEHLESLGKKVTIIVKSDSDIKGFGGIKLKYPELKRLIRETEKKYNKTKKNGN